MATFAGLVASLAGCPEEKAPAPYVPATYSISGTVSGAIAEGVTVTAVGTGLSAVTAANGSYTISGLSNGTYTVEPSLAGYAFTPATRSATVNGASVTGQNFVARAGLQIAGKVTGPVVEGVTVSLTGAAAATTTTDANGDFVFFGVVAGTYTVTPSLAGGWTFSPANSLVTVGALSVTGPYFTAIPPVHSISGKVTGAAIAGVVVTLSGAADAVTLTDGTGNYTFTGLAPGSYAVAASRAGFAFTPPSLDVSVAGADVTGKDFAAVAVHRISGRVTGAALEGIAVALSGKAEATATTDASGYFEFAGLVDGAYVVTPMHGGLTFTPPTRSITVAGADVTNANFAGAQAQTYSVAGTVSGGVVGGVTLTLAGPASFVTAASAAGAFSFAGIPPGDYMLIPANEDYVFDPASRVVQVLAANVAAQNFAATLKLNARTITGTISGDGVAGVTVSLSGSATATTKTDAYGRFAFRNLADGTYSVVPALAGLAFSPANCLVTIAGPSVTEVAFTASFSRSISGKVTGAVTAGVLVTLSGGADAFTVTASDGSYTFANLANGDYVVTPGLTGYGFAPAEVAIKLEGSDAVGVDFLAMTTHRIAGTVSGDVLEGVDVALSGAAGVLTTTTIASGYYEFIGLLDGTYYVTPTLAGYSFTPPSFPVALAGADATADFVATLIPTWTVFGTVSGAILEGVEVKLSGAATGSTTTDVSGNYAFSGLTDGSYMVIPSKVGYVFAPASRAFRVNGADVAAQGFTSTVAP